ncbi:hypothetical protein [Chryseobacterium paludis]|uniref:hypothetical protein n=1 Tax=Chryseobacterium paludis TaxID=2956784 RepID=UPI0021C1FDBB|nr:hypothetical protein [Chryseobacterium paludis]
MVLILVSIAILYYYNYMMNGNYTFIYIILFPLIILVALSTFSMSFFKSYAEVIKIINDEDLAQLETMNQSRSWIEKYLPSFIIYSGKIRVFKLFKQPDFYFKDLSKISIRTFYNRGGQNHLVILKKIQGGSYFFSISNSFLQQKHLIEKAMEYNPNIIVNEK